MVVSMFMTPCVSGGRFGFPIGTIGGRWVGGGVTGNHFRLRLQYASCQAVLLFRPNGGPPTPIPVFTVVSGTRESRLALGDEHHGSAARENAVGEAAHDMQ